MTAAEGELPDWVIKDMADRIVSSLEEKLETRVQEYISSIEGKLEIIAFQQFYSVKGQLIRDGQTELLNEFIANHPMKEVREKRKSR